MDCVPAQTWQVLECVLEHCVRDNKTLQRALRPVCSGLANRISAHVERLTVSEFNGWCLKRFTSVKELRVVAFKDTHAELFAALGEPLICDKLEELLIEFADARARRAAPGRCTLRMCLSR